MPQDRFRFGRHDRITVQGATYRFVAKVKASHVLQLVTDGHVLGDHHVMFSDDEIRQLYLERKIRVDEDFFSYAAQVARARGDSDLTGLSDDEVKTVHWKTQWCVSYERAHARPGGSTRAPRTPAGLKAFIEGKKAEMNDWYVAEFGGPRPVGRSFQGERRKPFDFPSPSTLRDWLVRFHEGNGSQDAFKPMYAKCGNREQLDARARAIVERAVLRYGSRAAPTASEVYTLVEDDLEKLNESLPPGAKKVYVSERAVRRRIRELPPLFVEAARHGEDGAKRKYMPVGKGIRTADGISKITRMQRVEVDDWEMDLHAILTEKKVWENLTLEARKEAKRLSKGLSVVRCTVTAAIDVATKCIVGLNVTPFAPSPAGSKTAIRSIFADKNAIAAAMGAGSNWPMCARPLKIATDGGPAFKGDFHEALVQLKIEHSVPGQDPRNRGTIESFFRRLKVFCRHFTGQAFSNVVEKGDYKSETLASLVVEDLQELLVCFIVDDYHHRPHYGLGGRTPYGAWKDADNDLAPPPDHVQRFVAFGMPVRNRHIDAAGIVFLNVQYAHPKMGVLHGLIGRRGLTIVVDAFDMGSILVRIPPDVRARFLDEGDYLTFTAEAFAGVSVASHLLRRQEVAELAKEDELAGRPFRLGVHRKLMPAAEAARDLAGAPSDEYSWKDFEDLIVRAERQGGQVVSTPVVPAGPSRDLRRERSQGIGRSVAVPKPKPADGSRARPAGGFVRTRSINVRKED